MGSRIYGLSEQICRFKKIYRSDRLGDGYTSSDNAGSSKIRSGQSVYEQYERFLKSDRQILFVHIREKEEIEKFKSMVKSRCLTLLVEGQTDIKKWGNASDDEVKNYNYDLCYKNDKPLDEAEKDFVDFLKKLL